MDWLHRLVETLSSSTTVRTALSMQTRAVPLRVASMWMRVHDSPGDFEAELAWRFFSSRAPERIFGSA